MKSGGIWLSTGKGARLAYVHAWPRTSEVYARLVCPRVKEVAYLSIVHDDINIVGSQAFTPALYLSTYSRKQPLKNIDTKHSASSRHNLGWKLEWVEFFSRTTSAQSHL